MNDSTCFPDFQYSQYLQLTVGDCPSGTSVQKWWGLADDFLELISVIWKFFAVSLNFCF